MKANGLRTAALLGGLSGLTAFGGEAFGGSNGLMMGFVLAIGMNFFSYFFSEKMALTMYRAQPVTPAENPQIYCANLPDGPATLPADEYARSEALGDP